MIFTDGDTGHIEQNQYYQDPSFVLGYLKCWGIGVCSPDDFGLSSDDFTIDTVEKAIDDGDWSEWYQEWKERIVEEWKREKEYQSE